MSEAGLFDSATYRLPCKPYRPSSGSEGLSFEWQWCNRCIKDVATREEPPRWGDGCPIWAAALILQADDAEYPEELVYHPKTGRPFCTAFVQDPAEPVFGGERTPFPLPSEVMGAYLGGSA